VKARPGRAEKGDCHSLVVPAFGAPLDRRRPGLTPRLTTSGRSLDPVLKMEYSKLVVDFPHLDRTLRQVLLIKAGVDRATERARSGR
jgi:hypothetical protein